MAAGGGCGKVDEAANVSVHLDLRSEGFVILAILAILLNYVDIALEIPILLRF